MILDKALLVKGAVGAASVAGLGGVVVFRKELGIVKESSGSKGKSSSDDSIDQNLQTTEPKTNNRENLANGDNSDDDHNDHQQQEHQASQGDEREHLGLPKGCKLDEGASSKTCSITKEDLAKIDFSNKGNEDLTVEGMNGESITLDITKVENDSATYPNGKKYTFKGLTKDIKIKVGNNQDNFIALEGGVDNDFKENSNSKLEKVPRKVLSDQDINDLNAKIQNLGLPAGCNFSKDKENDDQSAISCDIESLENMNKIAFSDKTDNKELKVEGDNEELDNLKIKIKKLTGTEKTSYVNDLEGDLLFTFLHLDETLKWKNDSDGIFIPKESNTEFKLSGGKLSKLWSPITLAQKVGLVCQENNNKECTIPTTNLNFHKDSHHHSKISMSSSTSGKFKFEKDVESYNQGFKYTYEGNGVTSGSFTLSNNDKFEIKYEKEQGWYLSHKS